MVLRLVDLPWRDVVYTHIFFRLDLRDLCRLRCLSMEYSVLVDNYFATLDTLDLSPCSNFEPCSFLGLVRACEGLRRVNLSNSDWLGNSHLVKLLGKCPGLTHLDLTGCNGEDMRHRGVERRGRGRRRGQRRRRLRNFIETTNCRNLTSVRLRGCDWVTAGFLSTLVRYNRNLRELVLADCYGISDQALSFMLEVRTALTDLSLERTTVSDWSLCAIADHCELLERLDLRSCSRITDEGLMRLRSLRFLKELRVSGCPLVTERGLASFRGRVEIDVRQRPLHAPARLSLQV